MPTPVSFSGNLMILGNNRIALHKYKSWSPHGPIATTTKAGFDDDVFDLGDLVTNHQGTIDTIIGASAGGGGGGGGGAITAADGAITTLGTRAQQAAADPTGTTDSLMSVLKGLWTSFITAFGTRRTLSSAALTADGSIPAGSFTVVIETSTDFAGTIAGGTVAGQRFFSFSEPGGLAAIAVTRTAGTLTYWRTA